MTPAELGRVEIRVARSPEGAARVELSAERPETLQRLMQDQSQLHQALDQAGIPSSDRTLHFSLSASAGSSTGGSLDASFTAGSGLGGQGQGAQGQAQNHGAGLARQQGSESIPSDWMQDDIAVPPVLITRTGLDITA